MAANNLQNTGLSQLIFEILLDYSTELFLEGEILDDQKMAQVKREVRRQFAAKGKGRAQVVFDLAFDRAFDEAACLLEQAQVGGWLYSLCQVENPALAAAN